MIGSSGVEFNCFFFSFSLFYCMGCIWRCVLLIFPPFLPLAILYLPHHTQPSYISFFLFSASELVFLCYIPLLTFILREKPRGFVYIIIPSTDYPNIISFFNSLCMYSVLRPIKLLLPRWFLVRYMSTSPVFNSIDNGSYG